MLENHLQGPLNAPRVQRAREELPVGGARVSLDVRPEKVAVWQEKKGAPAHVPLLLPEKSCRGVTNTVGCSPLLFGSAWWQRR